MRVTLTPTMPAFRIDDQVLGELWRLFEKRCGPETDGSSGLSVTDSLSGRGVTEERSHEYRDVDDLRRGSEEGRVLRRYRLSVSSSWRADRRSVVLHGHGGGAASLEVSGPDPAWCHEVAEAVLGILRPHGVWYGPLHRGGFWGPTWLLLGVLLALFASLSLLLALGVSPVWNGVVVGASIVVILAVGCREILFPASDVRVRPLVEEPRPPAEVRSFRPTGDVGPPDPGGGPAAPDSAGGDGSAGPARRRDGVVDLAGYARRNDSSGGS